MSQKVGESEGASLELFGSIDSQSDYLVMPGHHGTEPETTLRALLVGAH